MKERPLLKQEDQTTASQRTRYMICSGFSTPDLVIFEVRAPQRAVADNEVPSCGRSVRGRQLRPGMPLRTKGILLDRILEFVQSVAASRHTSYGGMCSSVRFGPQGELCYGERRKDWRKQRNRSPQPRHSLPAIAQPTPPRTPHQALLRRGRGSTVQAMRSQRRRSISLFIAAYAGSSQQFLFSPGSSRKS